MMEFNWSQMTRVFGRIGLLSFGGPAAQIALMHDALVARQKWLTEDQFLRALSLCMLLPGPEAMQLATYAGWRLRGVAGGVLAGLLFVVPGAVIILGLALVYVQFGDVPFVQAAFLGVKAAVIVVVLQALLRLGQKALTGRTAWVLAGAAFVALFVFGLPFPVVVLTAGLFGALSTKERAKEIPDTSQNSILPTVLTFAALWAAPLVFIWITAREFLLDIGLFFSKLAFVTFGGAYAVLAYMTQEVVQEHGWITTGQMIDALGLAETTPGPLILVTEFVALLAGYAQGGMSLALAAGALTLWVTFIPCFIWIFAAGPYLDHIAARPRLSAALSAITAAVVGVILNLSVWFALHVIFGTVGGSSILALPQPDLSTLNGWAVGLTFIAAYLMLRLKIGLLTTLAMMAGLGCTLSVTGLV
ncbi:chromate efflux transporter [Tateyamaria sp. ANG-S1]|uniref:chromate efflux transporter n=1 Tax=Tateyamaria sp. ANG-S1 TaxID=1577905 RepID=UPI00057DDF1E|nr:chromate efflux transporter [Tateyamaria sp. ANG-S1]KIC48878.1 chromate transporter [Tateyamaria sp. ANG-S1]